MGCGGTALLCDAERELLRLVPGASSVVRALAWCELEPRHDGPHYAMAQGGNDVEWWLAFTVDGMVHDLNVLAPCPAEIDDTDEAGETVPCMLFTGHLAAHRFGSDFPHEEVHVPRDPGFADLTEPQRANHLALHERGLTVTSYMQIQQVVINEKVLGVHSTQHLGLTTSIELPQIVRVPAREAGMSVAVAHGYVEVVERPLYEPVYGGPAALSVAVHLNEAGRDVCAEIDARFSDQD